MQCKNILSWSMSATLCKTAALMKTWLSSSQNILNSNHEIWKNNFSSHYIKCAQILLEVVGGRSGNYTKFIIFLRSQFIQNCKEFFFILGVGVKGWGS